MFRRARSVGDDRKKWGRLLAMAKMRDRREGFHLGRNEGGGEREREILTFYFIFFVLK